MCFVPQPLFQPQTPSKFGVFSPFILQIICTLPPNLKPTKNRACALIYQYKIYCTCNLPPRNNLSISFSHLKLLSQLKL